MPRVDPIQDSFTAGEISPRLWGRTTLNVYKLGLGKCENFLVYPHGGVSKRGGFRYVAEVKDSTKITIVQKFDYKNEFQYVFEFGHNYIRVFRNQTAVMGNGAPYEIVTTYTQTEVQDLRFAQDEEKLYIVHKDHLPAELVRTAHANWTLQNTSFSNVPAAWGAANYPTLIWFFEQRLWYASTPDEPNGIWGSKSGTYFDFDLGTGLADEGIALSAKKITKLLWGIDGDTAIMLGAHNGEFRLASNSLNEALTPSNVRVTQITNYGSAFIPPVQIDADVLFIQRGLRKVRKLQYNKNTNSYTAIPITIISEHITESGVIDVVYSNEPDSFFWAVRTDGVLIAMTYDTDNNVFGWHRHLVGGVDVKVQSITNIDGTTDVSKDELWAVIERTIVGKDPTTRKYIEFLVPEGLSPEDDQEDAFFVESGVTKTGSDFTTFDGLGHLEGEEVRILADGAVQAPKTVSSGEITLDDAADKAHAGLAYNAAVETLPLEGGNPIGTAQTKIKRISKIALRIYRSLTFYIGDVFGNEDVYPFGPADEMGSAIPLFTGDTEEVAFPGGYDTQGRVRIASYDPLPLTLLAIAYEVRTGE